MSATDEPALKRLTLTLCVKCIEGAGGECHTPGCALWMIRAPDVPIHGGDMDDVPDDERVDGLTVPEGTVMDRLLGAADAFAALEREHPDELRDFVDGIHRCQYLLALRVARRAFPTGWPKK